MFNLLNSETRVGNYKSKVCNFLSFSAASGAQSFRGSRHAFHVLDGMAVTKRGKAAIGLSIAHLYERPNPVRLNPREV
jgi:hypothetical protein